MDTTQWLTLSFHFILSGHFRWVSFCNNRWPKSLRFWWRGAQTEVKSMMWDSIYFQWGDEYWERWKLVHQKWARIPGPGTLLHFHRWWCRSEVKWVTQSCPTLCNPMYYPVHGILQARILEWVAIPCFGGSSQLRNLTQVSHIAGGIFTSWATRETQEYWSG